jgi:hypothetical protein
VVISKLQQLYDLCRVEYLTPLRLFDPSFYAGAVPQDAALRFHSVELPPLVPFIQDFYFLSHDVAVTKSMAYAMVALYELRPNKGGHPEILVDHLRIVNGILKHRLNNTILLSLYRILKDDPLADMQKTRGQSDALSAYLANTAAAFKSNQRRIQYELVNEEVAAQIPKLFDEQSLEELGGYNAATSALLQNIFQTAFYWVIPLQILKKFTEFCFSEKIRTLLEDFYQNGLFVSHNYQKTFSILVSQCSRTRERLVLFEQSFAAGETNGDILAAIQEKRMRKKTDDEKTVQRIHQVNEEARQILEEEAGRYFNLYGKIREILDDMKKTDTSVISNLRLLMMDNVEKIDLLERQLPKWALFFDLIQHYTTISPLNRK